MEMKLCNKCKKEIKRGVRLDGGPVHPNFYKLEVDGFTGEGRGMYHREYDLCEKCHNELVEFLSYRENSDVDSTDNEVKMYTKDIGLDKDKKEPETILIGERMSTNDAIPNAIQIGLGLKGIKSILKFGNIYWYTTKKFNSLQKYMWKKFFGVEIIRKDEK